MIEIFAPLLPGTFTFPLFVAALCVGIFAGFVKGVTGFAMPMVMISGLTTFLSPELALAALILPTAVTNIWQALRQGWRAAWDAIRKFGLFLGVGGAVLLGSAQLVNVFDTKILFGLIGVAITTFALMQLLGWRPALSATRRTEAAVGAVAGFIGGLSGVWGPPTVAYLTAINTPKAEHVRVQGVVYGLGAVALAGAHVQSGVLNEETWPFSAMMILPALGGMAIGMQVQDRIDQATFRKVTLVVLVIAGLNLMRRAIF